MRNAIPRQHTSEFPSYNYENKFQASRFLENRGVGLVELGGSRLNPSPCLMALPGKDGDILSGTGGFSKNIS